MKIHRTPIDGLMVVETGVHTDQRGFFKRLFCREELRELIGDRQIVQINQSCTQNRGAVRGLHYQYMPHAEMKLIRCLKGSVWDVAVDLRAGSESFLQWHAEELSSTNSRMMVIPEGCAHGFQVLEADSELLYLHTEFYQPSVESGVCPTDSELAISWPLPVSDLSERDRTHPPLTTKFTGLTV